MAKGCELCGKAARMYCESDEASLCWGCDEKVHGANFLVARHERTLLCQVCRSLTPWKSSGSKLCPTVSVCEACVNNNNNNNNSNECQRGQVAESQESINDHDEDDDDSDDEDEDGDYSSDEDEEYEVEEEEEEGENQVVPWSCASSPPPPPPSSTSSEEEEEEKEELSSTAFSTLKRARVNTDLDSDDEIGCSTSLTLRATGALANEEASSLGSLRARKQRKITTEANQSEKGQEEPRSAAIINSLRRLQNDIAIDGQDAVATVLKLSRDQSR